MKKLVEKHLITNITDTALLNRSFSRVDTVSMGHCSLFLKTIWTFLKWFYFYLLSIFNFFHAPNTILWVFFFLSKLHCSGEKESELLWQMYCARGGGSVWGRCHSQCTSVGPGRFKPATFQTQVHFFNHQATTLIYSQTKLVIWTNWSE